MATPSWFSLDYYLAEKAGQLNTQNYGGKSDWTSSDVSKMLSSSGLTAYDHYVKYGSAEGLNPNAYFDQGYYLQEKANSLNAANYEGRSNWTASDVLSSFSSAGVTTYEHFSRYGVTEGLDPSSSFSVGKYLGNKANALNAAAVDGKTDWTASEVLNSLESLGLDPVSHFMLYGKSEGSSPASGGSYSLTAVYGNYYSYGFDTGITQLALNGIVGSTVSASLTESYTGAASCSNPSSIATLGTNSNVYIIDASGVAGAGVELAGNSTANILIGSAADDVITGGKGTDSLTGNAGSDKFVFHFGDASQNSDSYSYSGTDTTQMLLGMPDTIDDFTVGTDKISLLTSSGAQENPTAVYYGGTVHVTYNVTTNMSANSASITDANGTTTSYDLTSSDALAQYNQALHTCAVNDKNGSLGGTEALGANEAVVWNVELTMAFDSTSSTSTYSMLAVNDNDATFNSKDVVINLGYTAFNGSYDATTGLVSSSFFSS